MSLTPINLKNQYLVALDPETGEQRAKVALVPPNLNTPSHQYPYQGRTVEEITIPAGSVLQWVEERDRYAP